MSQENKQQKKKKTWGERWAEAKNGIRESLEWLSPVLEWLFFTGLISVLPLGYEFFKTLQRSTNTGTSLLEALRHGELLIISTVLCADSLGKIIFSRRANIVVKGMFGFLAIAIGLGGVLYFGAIKSTEDARMDRLEHVYKMVQEADAKTSLLSDIIEYVENDPVQVDPINLQVSRNKQIFEISLQAYLAALFVGCFSSMISAESRKRGNREPGNPT